MTFIQKNGSSIVHAGHLGAMNGLMKNYTSGYTWCNQPGWGNSWRQVNTLAPGSRWCKKCFPDGSPPAEMLHRK